MGYRLRTALLSAILASLACSPSPVSPSYESGCEGACQRWRDLGCEEGEPTPAGESCEDVCINVQGSGVIGLDTDCVTRAKSCATARDCN